MAKKEKIDNETAQDGGSLSIPLWMWPIVPLMAIAGIALALWQLPTIAFAAVTGKPALKVESDGVLAMYVLALVLIFFVSWGWPFAAMYLVSSLV